MPTEAMAHLQLHWKALLQLQGKALPPSLPGANPKCLFSSRKPSKKLGGERPQAKGAWAKGQGQEEKQKARGRKCPAPRGAGIAPSESEENSWLHTCVHMHHIWQINPQSLIRGFLFRVLIFGGRFWTFSKGLPPCGGLAPHPERSPAGLSERSDCSELDDRWLSMLTSKLLTFV